MLTKDLLAVLPLIILVIGGLLTLLVDVLLKRTWIRAFFSLQFVVCALIALAWNGLVNPQEKLVFFNAMADDLWSRILTALVLLGTLFTIICSSFSKEFKENIFPGGEYYALILFASFGAIIFGAATEWITWFIGLEIMSMSLYALCGFNLGRKVSSEAAIKYFLLGSFSSAFLLYGLALIYGLTGSTQFSVISEYFLNNSLNMISYVSLGLIVAGLIFKIGLVPLQFWVPDVYQGAPTAVTIYMATVVKTSAIMAAIRVLWLTFGHSLQIWKGAIWLVVVLTLVFANIVAIRQKSLKRMLAYSSLSHAAFITMALLIPDIKMTELSGNAIIYYLIVYTLMTVGSFGVLLTQSNSESFNDDITLYNGFAKNQPLLAALMAFFMLALAGLPPALGGLVAKFYVFAAVLKAGYLGLVIIAALSAVVASYYYLRVIVAMYFIEPHSDTLNFNSGILAKLVLALCALAILVLGIYPI